MTGALVGIFIYTRKRDKTAGATPCMCVPCARLYTIIFLSSFVKTAFVAPISYRILKFSLFRNFFFFFFTDTSMSHRRLSYIIIIIITIQYCVYIEIPDPTVSDGKKTQYVWYTTIGTAYTVCVFCVHNNNIVVFTIFSVITVIKRYVFFLSLQ